MAFLSLEDLEEHDHVLLWPVLLWWRKPERQRERQTERGYKPGAKSFVTPTLHANTRNFRWKQTVLICSFQTSFSLFWLGWWDGASRSFLTNDFLLFYMACLDEVLSLYNCVNCFSRQMLSASLWWQKSNKLNFKSIDLFKRILVALLLGCNYSLCVGQHTG